MERDGQINATGAHNDTMEAVNVAENAVGAANTANTISKDNSRVSLRAYLTSGVPITKVYPSKVIIGVPITNSGQTPAIEVNVSGDAEPKFLTYDKWAAKIAGNRGGKQVIGAHDTYLNKGAGYASVDFFGNAGRHVFVTGRITYKGIFDPSTVHRTDYCFDYVVPSGSATDIEIPMCIDRRRNSIDDECPK